MSPLIILIATLTFSLCEITDPGDNTADNAQLEHRLDDIQKTLKNQRIMLEQLQNGIFVKQSNLRAKRIIADCSEADITGKYFLQLPDNSSVFPVVCEAESFDGGWLVVQQRINGGLSFYRDWDDYKEGFGYIGKFNEFWLGLERMHQITNSGLYDLALELKNESGEYRYAVFKNFQIAAEDDNYRLSKEFRLIEGTLKGGMDVLHGTQFSTFNRDNDDDDILHCGSRYKSGFWFFVCNSANLNGPFNMDPKTGRGIYWNGWTDAGTYSRMMIRRS